MVAKRHHFVPKCYLESFSVKNPRKKKSNLYAFDAVERKVFRPAPDNVALQTDFNTIDLDGHEPDAFERAMASVESDIGPALVRIFLKFCSAGDDVHDNSSKPPFTAPMESIFWVARSI
jgi:hypothetical protein